MVDLRDTDVVVGLGSGGKSVPANQPAGLSPRSLWFGYCLSTIPGYSASNLGPDAKAFRLISRRALAPGPFGLVTVYQQFQTIRRRTSDRTLRRSGQSAGGP
jgi:hypothetical protein